MHDAPENTDVQGSRGTRRASEREPLSGNITAIDTTIVEVEVISDQGKIFTVSTVPQTFNLLDLTSMNPMELIRANLPSGRYCEIRLFFPHKSSITVSGKKYPLEIEDDIKGVNTCIKAPPVKNDDDADHAPKIEKSRLEELGVVRLMGAFELTEGFLYAMTLDFNPNNSITYDAEDREYELTPNIKIVSSSLVNGLFNASGLLEGETVISELRPDGTFRVLSSLEPRSSVNGHYFFNYATRILHFEPVNAVCSTCSQIGAIPIAIFYNMDVADVLISTWNETTIIGSVGEGLLSRSVTFSKTSVSTIDTTTGYSHMNVTVTYPDASFEGKIGLISLVPKFDPGRTFVDAQKITNRTATFVFIIPYTELPGGVPGGSRVYLATPIVATNLTDLKINAAANGFVCGNVSLAKRNYLVTVPVADKQLSASVDFIPIP